jgi:soluble lytic murein transglycosylase-like protein
MAGEEDIPIGAAIPEGLSNLVNLFATHAPVASRVMEGQELLKRFNSPELAPSWLDGFVWNHASAQRKKEERARIAVTLHNYIQDAFKKGEHAILPAFFRPLKEGEASALVQAQANSPQAKLAQAFQRQVNAPSNTATMDPAVPSTYLQAGQAVPPGQAEITSRIATLLPQFLPRIAATSGNVGNMFKAVQEQRAQHMEQVTAPLLEQAANEVKGTLSTSGSAPTAAPSQTPVTMTPLKPQGQYTVPPELQPLATRAQAAGVHPPFALALIGNEASGPQAISPDGATGRWQLMPGTAKPFLIAQGYPAARLDTDDEIRAGRAPKITAILKDPTINERTGLMLSKQLQEKYPGRYDLAFAEYHGGPGAVIGGPNGTVNPKSADVNMPTTEYVRRGMARMQALGGQQQAQTPTSTMAASPGVSAPSIQAEPPALTPFKYNPKMTVRGLSVSGGKPSIELKPQSREEQATNYVRTNGAKHPQLYVDAMQQLRTDPEAYISDRDMESLAKEATQATLAQALGTGIPFQDAFNQARLKLGPVGLFHAQTAQGMLDSGAAAALQAQGTVTGTAQGKTAPPYRQAEFEETQRLGPRAATTAYGQAQGAAGAVVGQPPVIPVPTEGVTPEQPESLSEQAYAKETARRVERQTQETLASSKALRQLPLVEAKAKIGSTHNYYYTGINGTNAGTTVSDTENYGDVVDAAGRKEVKALGPKQGDAVEQLASLIPFFNSAIEKLNTVYGPGGAYEKLSAGGRLTTGAWQSLLQNALQSGNGELPALSAQLKALATPISQILGEGSRPSDLDRKTYEALVPRTSGIPDTAAKAYQLWNDIQKAINSSFGKRFGIKDYTYPELVPITFGVDAAGNPVQIRMRQ